MSLIIRRAVIEDFVAKNPEKTYFDEGANRRIHCVFDLALTLEGCIGEDYLFCDGVRENGFKIWVDPSIKLGYLGVQEYMGDFATDVIGPLNKNGQ